GGDGVLQNTLDALQVAARTPPGMTVNVLTGIAFISNMPLALYQNVELLPITAPTTHPRIDLVQAGLSDWSFTIREGEEAAVPIPPEPDEDSLPLARIHLRPGMTSIKNSDDGINGYIEDTRTLL
ncbi:MAG: hypothetical protein KAH38_12830, partial [Candidatus Hydrogenedentes bacterium]|nr:hypothetical protein [Candidatus Hydrogenedentota bacterium]